VALTSEEFHREHLRVLNTKLDQKIDELHDVERQATESLTLLEAIQSSAPVGFGFVDREYRLRRVNDVLAAVGGAPVATLVNYACHATIMGPANRLITPDYPGAMKRVVEAAVGGRCVFEAGQIVEAG